MAIMHSDEGARLLIQRNLAPRTEDIDQVRAGLMAFNESAVGPVAITRFARIRSCAPDRSRNRGARGGLRGRAARHI